MHAQRTTSDQPFHLLRWRRPAAVQPRPAAALAALLLAPCLAVAGAASAAPGHSTTTAPAGATGHRIYVDHDATGNSDGSSWQDAYGNLQLALIQARALAAQGRVEMWVAAGVYRPNAPNANPNDRARAFQLASNVALYGGFAGTESALDQRDPAAHVTVLSGDMFDDDSTDADGVTLHHADIVGTNSYHVVVANGVDATAELDGFTITAGHANAGGLISPFLMRYGAGLYLHASEPMLRQLVVRGNSAPNSSSFGGGLYAENASSGPARTVHMQDVRFLHNYARGGGAIATLRTSLRGDAITFEHNSAVDGGALYLSLVSDVRFTNSVFAANSAANNGGAIRGFRERISLVNALLTGNHAGNDGGAYYSDGTSSLNLLIVLTNSTLAGNRAENSGGAIHRTLEDNGGTRLFNTVVWDNQDSSGTGTASASHGGPGAARLVAVNSLVQGMLAPGSDNLDGTLPGNAPLFIEPLDPATAPSTSGDFHVQIGSPLVDRGDNQARINPIIGTQPALPLQGNIGFDIDGRERILDGDNDSVATVDLGPFEGVAYTIGGSVSGLAGTGLLLRNNGGDDLLLDANGAFTFSQVVADQDAYAVTVAVQPDAPGQHCSVSAGSGTVDAASVTDVVVACVTNSFTVTPSAGANGSISPATLQMVDEGATTAFTVAADAGYDASVGGSCGGTLEGGVFTTAPINADCTVQASFVPRTSSTMAASANPTRMLQPVEFVVEVLGVDAPPLDGLVEVTAGSGESCEDSGPAQVTGNVARFACTISFTSLGERTVHATYTGSSTHSGSTTASIDVAVKRFADIEVTIDDGEVQANPGGAVAYLVQLRNNGPDDAPNTQIVLVADPSLDAPTWVCIAEGVSSCPEAGGSGELSMFANLPPGGGLDFIQEGALPTSLPAEVLATVQASVSGDDPDQVFDPALGNNSAVDGNGNDGVFGDGFEQPSGLR